MKVFEKTITMTKDHTDHQGHVNNVQYLKWASTMAASHWEAVVEEDYRKQFIWVVKDHFIEYKKAVFEGEVLKLRTYIAKNEGLKGTRIVEFLREEKIVVQIKSTWVMLDKSSNRPKLLAPELVERFL